MNRTDFENEFVDSENLSDNLSDNERLHSIKGNGIRKMYLAAFCALLISLSAGLSSGYSAPATYDMVFRPSSSVKPNVKEVMWIGSIIALGLAAGSLIAGPLADKIGRKGTLIYNIVPSGFGWIIICYAESVPVVLLGRFLSGISFGVICVAVPMYCVEISTPEVRGILGSSFQGFVVIGNLLSVTVGAYISWKYLAVHGAAVTIFAVMCFCFVPETPRWFLMKNDLKNAIFVMDKLQGGFVDVAKECEKIHKDLQNHPNGNITLSELKHPTVIKPALISTAVMFFQQFSGINAVFIYSSSIFEVSKDFMDPKTATIILAAVQVVATFISNLIVDKAGRKRLLIISGSLMALSFVIFGVYYYMLTDNASIGETYAWIPLACVVLSAIGYSAGYGPIPYLISAEMLPVRVRSTVSAILNMLGGIFAFIVTNTFSDMEKLLHNYGTFWFFSTVSVVGILFVILFVPETKGKRLEEIQDLFYKEPARQDVNILPTA